MDDRRDPVRPHRDDRSGPPRRLWPAPGGQAPAPL